MTSHPPQLRSQGPRWARPGEFGRHRIDSRFVSWLLDRASLTERLVAACSGRFEVRVDFQGWGRARLDEARALGLRRNRHALVREVHLLCDGQPWVFARTVIPRATLSGRGRRLAGLGNRPLGAFLFADPSMRRGPVEIAAIERGSELYAHALRGSRRRPARIWGRRSVFRLAGKPLLVSEIFLPGLPEAGP